MKSTITIYLTPVNQMNRAYIYCTGQHIIIYFVLLHAVCCIYVCCLFYLMNTNTLKVQVLVHASLGGLFICILTSVILQFLLH